MDERFDALIAYWVEAFGIIAKPLQRCDITIATPDPGIIAITRPALARVLPQLNHPTIPAEAGRAIATAAIKWLVVGEILDNFEDDPTNWRYEAILGLLGEIQIMAEIANNLLDRRHRLN